MILTVTEVETETFSTQLYRRNQWIQGNREFEDIPLGEIFGEEHEIRVNYERFPDEYLDLAEWIRVIVGDI